MTKIGIIIGSTRPGRKAAAVARWAHDIAQKRDDAEFDLVDIADFNLPLLDELIPALFGQYSRDHTRAWSAKIASFDGYVFVTPEYNQGTSAALKNAIDFLVPRVDQQSGGIHCLWRGMGARAVEHLRLVMAELQVATVRAQVGLSLFPRRCGERDRLIRNGVHAFASQFVTCKVSSDFAH